jgi:hypothetical protein
MTVSTSETGTANAGSVLRVVLCDVQSIDIYVGASWSPSCRNLEASQLQAGTSNLFLSCDLDEDSAAAHAANLKPLGYDQLHMDADARTALLRELGVTTLPFCARVSRNGTSFTVVPKHFTVEQHAAEGDAAAHHTAALELYEAGDAAGALYSFSLTLAVEPTHTSAAYNAGVLLHSVGLSLLAVPFLAAVVEHTPQDATAHSVLGTMLYSCEPAAVIAAYRAVVARHLGEEAHALSAHRLAALAGEGPSAVTADPAYVRQVFDRLAPSFEGTLVDHLQYRVPWQLLEAVTSVQPPPAAAAAAAKAAAVPAVVEPAIAAAVPVAQAKNSSSSGTSTDSAAGTGATAAGTTTADSVDASTAADSVTAAIGWTVLDLGCGSGLCGRLFHEYTAAIGGHCTGVDLSPKMVRYVMRSLL